MEPCNGISFDERPSMIETSPLALSEFQDIRAQTFSKEDFLNTTTPYDLLAHYRHDEFHHSQMLAVMQDKAEQAGTENPSGKAYGNENACVGESGAETSEGRAIRASQTGVKPHFTAIAEVFRQAVAENAGHKITLYNDFSGRTESAMELTCM